MCFSLCAAEDPTDVPEYPRIYIPSGEELPATAAEWSELGDTLVELRRDTEALQAYEYAVFLDPKDAKTWGKYGQILVREYMYEQAREAYDRALAVSPDDAMIWNNLGSLLFQMGFLAEAVAAFEQAIALDPGYIPQSSQEERELVQPIPRSENVAKSTGFPFIFFINNVLLGIGMIIIALLYRLRRSPSEDENR